MERIIFADGTEVNTEMFGELTGMIITVCDYTPSEAILSFGDETKMKTIRHAVGDSEKSYSGYKLDFVSMLDGKANVILKQV